MDPLQHDAGRLFPQVLDSVKRSKHLKSLSLKKVSPTKTNREHFSLPTSANNLSTISLNQIGKTWLRKIAAPKCCEAEVFGSKQGVQVMKKHTFLWRHFSCKSIGPTQGTTKKLTAERTQHATLDFLLEGAPSYCP